MENNYIIALAKPEHLDVLSQIERAAAECFPAGMIPEAVKNFGKPFPRIYNAPDHHSKSGPIQRCKLPRFKRQVIFPGLNHCASFIFMHVSSTPCIIANHTILAAPCLPNV